MSKRVVLECTGTPLTKQSFKPECDINLIMRRFKKTVGMEFLNKFNGYTGGQFGDFSNVADYRSALEQVRQADEVFMRLPAQVRKQFDNDAAKFLDFVGDPKNGDALVSMGLATKRAPVQDAPSKPVDQAVKSA